VPPPGKCTVSAEALRQALGQVLFAVSRDTGRPELADVVVECKDGSLRVVTSDSYRLPVWDIVPEAATQQGHIRTLVGTPYVVAPPRPARTCSA
jgi:DNA polymerase III sliding clamp (beta) subunit (PCNA family)